MNSPSRFYDGILTALRVAVISYMMSAVRQALRPILVACLFVCPLLFFTNLTRNPYITQICLLNAALLWGGALLLWRAGDEGPAALPRTPLDLPLAAWTAVCALSWGVAYALHRPFFRPSMAAEGERAFLFLLANTLCPFYLAAWLASSDGEAEQEVNVGAWAFFAIAWGLLWTVFPQARGGAAAPADLWGHFWDGYGFCVWAAGIAGAWRLCRRARWIDFLHLAFAAGFIASAYGVLQYFNVEFIWPNVLNPYGGRAVSTFGNPNFLSSFNVVLLPISAALFSRSQGRRRVAYGVLALVLEAALLCSLTRSSWIGAVAAFAVLLASPRFRRAAADDPRPHGLLAGTAVAMVLLWPSSAIVSGYTPSVVGRISEVVTAARTHETYGSFYQRVLIWTCGWLMGAENPVTGKGYGLFELFYPFYQGHVVAHFEFWRGMRTHANNGHDEIVETFAQTGLLGLGVVAWMWATFFAASRFWLRRVGERAAVFAACAAGVAGMLVDNLLNVSVHFAVPGFIFWWAAGSAMGALNPAPASQAAKVAAKGAAKARQEEPGPRGAGSWTWGLRGAAALLVAVSWIWVRVWFREAHYFAGFKLLRQKQMSAAVRELERSRDWGPREVNAIYELGNAYAQSERYAEAAQAYRLALDANAGYDEIYYNLGAIQASRLGQTDRAMDNLRVTQWINPFSAEVYLTLGNLYLAAPQRYGEQGIALLEQATAFFPDNPTHWNNLGYLYSVSKRYADAERAYVRALSLDPGLAQARANLEAMTKQSGRPRLKLLSALDDMSALENRVVKRDYSDATLALAQRLDATLPDTPKVRFFLGALLMARGRPGDAVAPLEWVTARQPGHVWAHLNLGEAYLALGRRPEAEAQYRAVLSLDPANVVAQRRLGELAH